MTDGGRSTTDIARRLIALCNALGHNQTSFAALVGVEQSAMSNYMKGVRRPQLDVGIQIQMRTGVTLDWLYLGDRQGLPARLLAELPDLSGQQQRAG